MRPSDVDNLPPVPGEPKDWHVREKTEDGYPLMGSSPAEREDSLMRALECRSYAMQDHGFEGEGRHCEARIGFWPMGSPETGTITSWVGCGYPQDMHPIPDPEPEWVGYYPESLWGSL